MEIEPLISGSKWTILELLSEKSLSPTEMAEKTKTSLANISQQLRLLEMTGIVKKERQNLREKGKPRMLFSLNDDYSYVVAMFHDFSAKKLFPATGHHKVVMKIWCLLDAGAHYAVEKFYFDCEQYLSGISEIYVTPDSKKIIVAVKDRESEKAVSSIKSEMEVQTVMDKGRGKIPPDSHRIY